jgi:[acyl-carrier-protein] S-malonyltransferase
MMPAQERLAADLEALAYSAMGFPVVHNVDAAANDDPAAVKDKLIQQVSSPVRWLQTLELMSSQEVNRFIEIGPGKVLTGLVRQSVPGAEYSNIENTEGLRNTLDSL